MSKNEWVKCFKINCSPALEVYKTHINFFGCNMDIEVIDRAIERHEKKIEYLKEAKEIWEKEFKKDDK